VRVVLFFFGAGDKEDDDGGDDDDDEYFALAEKYSEHLYFVSRIIDSNNKRG